MNDTSIDHTKYKLQQSPTREDWDNIPSKIEKEMFTIIEQAIKFTLYR